MSDRFQYCFKENGTIQSILDLYFEKLKRRIYANFKNNVSILLVGSLARGEGTWIENAGSYQMISDIEYFVIYNDSVKKLQKIEEILSNVYTEVFCGQQSGAFHIDYTFMHENEIPKLEKKLMVYEAKKFGKTITGVDYIKSLPDVSIDNISFNDIKDIISHRLFSMIYYGEKCKENPKEYTYLLAKNSLDLMTVYLANNKILEGGFYPRYKRFKEVSDNGQLISFFGECLNIKMGNTDSFKESLDEIKDIFISLCELLYKDTKIPAKNYIKNIKRRMRRIAGIFKRALQKRTISTFTRQYKEMEALFRSNKVIDDTLLVKHYVLYGYPENR